MNTRALVTWLLATVAAIAVAWVAIGQVGRQVVLDRPLDERLAEAAVSPDARTTSAGGGETAADLPVQASPGRSGPAGDQADDVDGGSTPAEPGPDGPAATPPPPAPAGEAGADPDPDHGPTLVPDPIIRTYDAVGGSAAVVVVDGHVDLRWATPREGFHVSIDRSSGGRSLRIEFRSDLHRSRIEITVEEGQISADIREDDRA